MDALCKVCGNSEVSYISLGQSHGDYALGIGWLASIYPLGCEDPLHIISKATKR